MDLTNLIIILVFFILLFTILKSKKERYGIVTPHFDKAREVLDKGDSPCSLCGGDYPSVAPKRDRYYQPEQGYLGESILSGFPFYKAY